MNRRRPSVLWVTEEVPDRDLGGGNIRQANLLIELARHLDADLLVAGRVVDPAVRAAARSITEVQLEGRAPSRTSALRALLLGRTPLTVSAAAPAIRALRRALRAQVVEHDLVVLNHDTLYPLVADIRGSLRVAHPHNVGSARAAQAAAVASGWRSRLVWQAEARAHRLLEHRVAAGVDALLTCSEEDRRTLLRGLPAAAPAVLVAPNGVDLDRFRATPLPGSGRVLFFGSLDYPPNVDGIVWFVENVWPAVRAAAPGAKLSVVGRNPTPAVRSLGRHPDVEVEGDVPHAAPWYESADVVVVPIRIGTGTRIKALEAMAAGRPAVGTTIGMEGLLLDADPTGPQVAAVVDTADAFAKAVATCLLDSDRSARMANAGRAHVERHYGWPAVAAALAAQFVDLVEAAPPRDR